MEANCKAGFWDDAEVISRYTREQAIDDGFLHDVSSIAREAGITIPVAMTAAVYADCVVWTDADSKRQTYQDMAGRMWDVIWMASMSMGRAKRRGFEGNTLYYCMIRVPRGGRGTKPRKVFLKLMIGGGDNGEPVITIMLPDED